MRLTWLGHSSFLLQSAKGTRIVTDPFGSRIGYAMPKIVADIVTVSHDHFDHNCAGEVGGRPRILSRAGTYDIGGAHIEMTERFHDDRKGALRGRSLVTTIAMDGVTLCHMGDIGEKCGTWRLPAEHVNVLMIPVGGNYTVDARGAKEYVDAIRPDVVIPMHYKTPDLTIDIAGAEEFLSLISDKNVLYAAGCAVEFAPSDFDGQSDTQALVLKRYSD